MPRLLLVDDNPSINRIVESLLDGTPIEVAHAGTASDALRLLDGEAPFDLALLDTSLPEMDGWELLGRLRENPKAANMPVAMMAGVLEDIDHAKAESAQIQALLLKPVDFRDLPERVQGIIAAGVSARAVLPEPSPVAAAAAPVAPLAASAGDDDLLLLEELDLVPDAEEGIAEGATESPGAPEVDAPEPVQEPAPEPVPEIDPEMEFVPAPVSAPEPEPPADLAPTDDAAFSLSLETLDIGDMELPAGAAPAEATETEAEAFMPLPDTEPPQGSGREDASDFIDFADTSPEDFDLGRQEGAAPEDELFDLEDGGDGDGQAVEGDVGPLASSLESELLSDQKFIDAVARAVTKVVADKLSH
jgi:CheY-like chemotaxis protein